MEFKSKDMELRYGVQLKKGPFERRTADFLWMMMIFGSFTLLVLSAMQFFWTPFLGVFLVFMLLYLWSREFPNAKISLYGLVNLTVLKVFLSVGIFKNLFSSIENCFNFLKLGSYSTGFLLPMEMLALDVIFGSKIMPDLPDIVAGHLYYFLTALHPLGTGKKLPEDPQMGVSLIQISD